MKKNLQPLTNILLTFFLLGFCNSPGVANKELDSNPSAPNALLSERLATVPAPALESLPIQNGEFDSGTSNWTLTDFTSPSGSSISVVQGAGLSGTNSLRVDVVNADNSDWKLQVQQLLGFRLEVGKTYRVRFMAKAESARIMNVALFGNGTYYNYYYSYTPFNLTTAAQTFEFEYTCTNANVNSDPNFSLKFHLANGVISDVWLDKIEVEDITGMVTDVSVDPALVALNVGQTWQLAKTITPSNAINQNVVWSSSNNNVATVSSSGLVTAVAPGSATITATTQDGGLTASSVVNVPTNGSTPILNGEFDSGTSNWILSDYTSPSGANLSSVAGGGLSGSNALKVDVVNNNNTYWHLELKQILNFRFEVGKTYRISFMAKAQSNRDINVSLWGNGTNTEYYLTGFSLTTSPQNLTFDFTFNNTNVNNESSFALKFYLANGVISDVWLDKIIVQDITGMVTGVSIDPSFVALNVGQTWQLTKTITPSNATNQNVTWSSSNDNVATVNSAGLVTAAAPGAVTITATTTDGGLVATSLINVQSFGSTPVQNSEFDSGTTNWDLDDYTTYPSTATISAVTGAGLSGTNALRVDVQNNDNSGWMLQLWQRLPFRFEQGKTYRVSFMAKAETARVASLALWGNGSNSDYYIATFNNLTTTSQTFSFDHTVNNANVNSEPSFSLKFYLANGVISDVWLDKIAVEDITSIVNVTGVSISPTTLALDVGQEGQLTKSITPANATNQIVTWTSNNSSVVTVNAAGLVAALSAGTATITATTASGSFTATSTVNVGIPVTGVSIAPTTLSLALGQTGQLTKTILPANATNQNVTWSSSNTAVATVDNNGLVTAVAGGLATITATTVSGNFTASTTVTVGILVAGVIVTPGSLELQPGQTSDLTETISPANATNQTVTWSSNNASVATVNSSGLVTAVAAGSANIIVTTADGSFTAQSEITVPESSSTSSVLQQFAFQYKYDGRKRMTHKKVPGAEWVYMVYDKRDRLVMTQDGEQRKNQEWTFTKYDEVNRPVLMGIYVGAGDQEAMQIIVDDFYAATDNVGNTDEWFEVSASVVHGYSNQTFPKVANESEYLTVTYYDDYTFQPLIGSTASNFNYDENQLSASGSDPGQRSEEFLRVQGQVTGAKVKNLDTNEFLWSINYYDDRYRLIQVVAQNNKGGLDKNTNVYDFAGKVLRTKTDHNTTGPNPTAVATSRKLSYDHAGRLLEIEHTTGTSYPIVIAKNEYNELGQLVTKKLHTEGGYNLKQQVDYRYNIRGWLTRINDSNLSAMDGGPKDYFGMELGYNESIGIAAGLQHNGNISAIKWSTNQGLGFNDSGLEIFEPTARAYAFDYDPLNRLKKSEHYENTIGWNPAESFHENIDQYDLNGNIEILNRTGKGGNNMDKLDYTYSGNRLQKVVDDGNDGEGFKDGNTTGIDYIYDDNGNMVTDKNKSIAAIEYNHLNLPAKVTKTTGEYVKYIYNAAGIKLSQEVYNASHVRQKKTDYLGEFYYENDTLKFINHDEGRVVMTGVYAPEYQYTLKDHLGNTRITFTSKIRDEVFVATMEENYSEIDEQSIFGNYRRTTNDLLDITDEGTLYDKVLVLNGGYNGQVGLTKSFAVIPGDRVNASVYAKYIGSTGPPADPGALEDFAGALTQAFGLTSGLPTEGATAFEALNAFGTMIASGEKEDDDADPKGFLNILVFDTQYNLVDFAYQQIDAAFVQSGATKGEHDFLEVDVEIRQPGFVYVFLSNESETELQIGFDDYYVWHSKTNVIQQDDYYPFGLTFNSYRRENSVYQRFKFQGQEHIDDLGLGWDSFKWRNHQPDIGRFFNVDPLAEKYVYNSPYAFSENKVISHRELEGLEAELVIAPAIPILVGGAELIEAGLVALGGTALVATVSEFGDEIVEGFNNAVDKAAANGGLGYGTPAVSFAQSPGGVRSLNADSKTSATENKQIDPTANRVKPRKATLEKVKENQPRNEQDEMVDPNTGKPIDPNKKDLGHKPGNEWKKRKEMHKENGSTRKEVIEAENDPNLYQYEDRSSNRSHQFEKKD